ncbi:hypothetical protein BH09ACT5_BH09ACT5_14290 [soil metagenome]
MLAVSGAVLLHLAAQVSMLVFRPDWSITSFRNYFASDQLSYMGIVASAAHGQFASVEPFTETGSIYYPRAYYLLLGAVSNVFGVQPTTAWAVVGLLAQMTLVVAVAIACIVLSGKMWTGILGAGPFVIGTFSFLTTNGGWFTGLSSHAVLWGPFGVLFTLNAESAGLCAGGIALLLLLLAYLRVRSRRARVILTAVAALIIGGLANVQTYSFLTTIYLATFVVAAWAVVTAKRRWPAYVSVALIPVLFILGPVVSERGSPLVTLIFGLLPAVPGIIVLIARSWSVVVYFVLAALAAAPSVGATLLGLANKDPFLVYRVASTKDLGVDWHAGLIASLALSVPLVLVFIAGIRRRRSLWIAYPLGVGVAWTLLATNDIWRANQEPYRFWIDSFALISLTLLPILVTVVQEYLAPASRVTAPGAPLGGIEPEPVLALASVPGEITRADRRVALVALIVVGVLVLVSMLDWARFYRDGIYQGLISYSGDRDLAIADAASKAPEGLIMVDPCVDPQSLKIVSGKPVVYMNFGMAWPEKYEDVLQLLAARGEGTLDEASAANADVQWLVTDSACESDWAEEYEDRLTSAATATYDIGGGTQTITLWRYDSVG